MGPHDDYAQQSQQANGSASGVFFRGKFVSPSKPAGNGNSSRGTSCSNTFSPHCRDPSTSPLCVRSTLLDERASGDGYSLTRGKLVQVVWAMAESGSTGPFYPVDRVLSSRTNCGQQEYLLRWQGYGAEFDSWEPESHLTPGARDILEEFHRRSRQPGEGLFAEESHIEKRRTPRKQASRFAPPLASPTPPPTPPYEKRFPDQSSAKQRKRTPARSRVSTRSVTKRQAYASGSGLFFSDDETDIVDDTASAVDCTEERRLNEAGVPVAQVVKHTLSAIGDAVSLPVTRVHLPIESSPSDSAPLATPPYSQTPSVSSDSDVIEAMPELFDNCSQPAPATGLLPPSSAPIDDGDGALIVPMFARRAFGVFIIAYLAIIFLMAFSVPSFGRGLSAS